jgi:HAE1 family hydrophobic/amphiphilic exporter-1
MAFFPGEGSEMVAPIGKTVLGGLSFGTLMTLFLMPVVYAIMNKRSDERAARAEARRDRIAAGISRKQARRNSSGTKVPGTTNPGDKAPDGEEPEIPEQYARDTPLGEAGL